MANTYTSYWYSALRSLGHMLYPSGLSSIRSSWMDTSKLNEYIIQTNKSMSSRLNKLFARGSDIEILEKVASPLMSMLGVTYVFIFVMFQFMNLSPIMHVVITLCVLLSVVYMDSCMSYLKSSNSTVLNRRRRPYSTVQWMSFIGSIVIGSLLGFYYHSILSSVLNILNIPLTSSFAKIASLALIVLCSMTQELRKIFKDNNLSHKSHAKLNSDRYVLLQMSMGIAFSLWFILSREIQLLNALWQGVYIVPVYFSLILIHQFNIHYGIHRAIYGSGSQLDFLFLYHEKTQVVIGVMVNIIRSYIDFLLLGVIVEFAPIALVVRVVAGACSFANRYVSDTAIIESYQQVLNPMKSDDFDHGKGLDHGIGAHLLEEVALSVAECLPGVVGKSANN